MEVTELSRFLSMACIAPMGVPYMLILVREWRFPARTIRRLVLCLTLIYALSCTLNYLLFPHDPLFLILIAIVPVILCWILYAYTVRYRDGRLLFTIITVGLLTTITETIASLFFPFESYFWLCAKLLIVILVSTLLWLFGRKPFVYMLGWAERGWPQMSIIPFTFLLCLNATYTVPTIFNYGNFDVESALFLCACSPAAYYAIYYFLRLLREQYQSSQDTAVIRSQISVLQRQTDRVLENQKKNQIFRHDLRHFIRILDASIQSGDYAGTREVLDRMEAELDILSTSGGLRPYTGNTLLDTILSLSADRADLAGIDYSVRLSLPEGFRVDTTEFAVLLSNALDNAFNACLSQPAEAPRTIRVYNVPAAQQFFLSIDNTFAGDLVLSPETGLPVSHQPGHGYGTQSIAAFAQKYHAVLSCTCENGWFRLRLLI